MNKIIYLVKKEPPDSGYLAFESIDRIKEYLAIDEPEFQTVELIKDIKQTIIGNIQIPHIDNALDSCIKIKLKKAQTAYSLADAYPMINISDCIRQMEAWAIAGDRRYKYYDKTLTTWVERTYQRGFYVRKNYGKSDNSVTKRGDGFSDFKITNE